MLPPVYPKSNAGITQAWLKLRKVKVTSCKTLTINVLALQKLCLVTLQGSLILFNLLITLRLHNTA